MPDKKLIVFLEGQRIGILQEDISGKHSFIYDADAPAQLSLSMPRRSEPWTGKPIEAYIDGALPDDPMMRRAIGKQYGVNGNNPFALLSAIGLDCAGGAQFVPPEQIETVKDAPYSLVPISEKRNRATPRLHRGHKRCLMASLRRALVVERCTRQNCAPLCQWQMV